MSYNNKKRIENGFGYPGIPIKKIRLNTKSTKLKTSKTQKNRHPRIKKLYTKSFMKP
jgi:hypothetical protein